MSSNNKIDVLFVGGGTGGSVTPLLAVAERLGRGIQTAWIGTKQGIERDLAAKAGIRLYGINCGKFPRYFTFKHIYQPFLVLLGFFESLALLRRLRPKVIVSAGSFVATPVCWAATLLKIPYLVHQQDLKIGLTNKLIRHWAKKITTVFEIQKRYFKNAETIGNPVRKQILNGSREKAKKIIGIPSGKQVVLVIGGGTGAQQLNEWVKTARVKLPDVFFIHSTGEGKGESRQNDSYYSKPFFNAEELSDAYAVADVVVSRAGMGVISELGVLGKPTILVPLVGHQTKNAEFLREHGAVLVVSNLDGEGLTNAVTDLLSNKQKQEELSLSFRKLFPRGATENFVEIILGFIHSAPHQQSLIRANRRISKSQEPFANAKNIVLVGAGGVGVSALAKYFLWRGCNVYGFDLYENEFTKDLEKHGAKIKIGESQKQSLPKNTDLLIFSAAVPENDALRQEAERRGIKCLSYPEALGEISKTRDTIAVTGTKGKTTVTALIGQILKIAGRNPMVILGGKSSAFEQGNFQPGCGPFVVEACEYRAHMLHIQPYRAVITNAMAEHLDFYKNQQDIEDRMLEFAQKLPDDGILIYGQDDAGARRVGEKFSGAKAGFGLYEPAQVSADERRVLADGQQSFRLFTHEISENSKHFRHIGHGWMTINLPGIFSVQNALAAAAAALSLGVSFHCIKNGLENFPSGLWRRFEKVGEWLGRQVISDYAHHPAAISSVLQASREVYPDKKIIAIFQPHLVSRTRSLFSEFTRCFAGADQILIMPTYRVAGREEKNRAETSPQELVAALQARSQLAVYVKNENVLKKNLKNISADSVLLFLGAGDIDLLARKFC